MRHAYASRSGSALRAMGAEPEKLIAVDASAEERVVVLPDAVVSRGMQLTVKKTAGTHDVVIYGNIQIDTQSEIRLSVVGSALTFASDGNAWYVI